MKKINKSGEPSSLTKFKRKNSSNKWEDIHTEQNRSIYEIACFNVWMTKITYVAIQR